MRKIRVGTDTDARDDYCECCGYPFDRGDAAYDVCEDGGGPLACSKKCAIWIVDNESYKWWGDPQSPRR